MANSYNPEFTLTLQGCYITAMVFGVYHGVRTFFHVYFSCFQAVSKT